MGMLPEEVMLAWNEREGPVVLGTVDGNGRPNLIYASIVHMTSGGRIAIADNYFDKTLANILAGSTASVLFITRNKKAYQVKGCIEYHTEGRPFEEMLSWADPKHPRKGVVVMNSEEVYSGTERLA